MMFRIPKRGQKGFTLIELLIVVAILGILAAVVIPNVGRFLGRGADEARRAEFHDVGTAITAMMVENSLADIPTGTYINTGTAATNDTRLFPVPEASCVPVTCKVTDAAGVAYTIADKGGYLLYGHDKAGGGTTPVVNYVNMTKTTYFYTYDADGTIYQWKEATKTTPYTY